MKTTNPSLVVSAILGILAGAACGGAQQTPATAQSTVNDKASCGNHEPGKCASVDAKPAPAASDTPLSITRNETIAPGKAIEINLSFAAAAQASATFKASAPVAWNVHSHPSGGMVEHQKGTSASGALTFQPTDAGVYSFLWKNDGDTPVTIEVAVRADRGVSEMRR